jgi:hypothetical protein
MQELNFTSTIWRPSCGEFFSSLFHSNKNVFYNFCCCIVDESVYLSGFVFKLKI